MNLRLLSTFIGLSLSLSLSAYSDFLLDYNKSHQKWFTSETDHFRVHYRSGLREQAEAAVSVAEEVYESVTDFYKHVLPGKVDFIVDDEDYSNGWALALANTMKIWAADLDFDLRGSHHWMRDVVTHEFSHIVSIQAGQKTRYNIPDLRLGYFDYYNEPVQTSGFSIYSFEIFPPWFAEGVAQYGSAAHGYDSWDSHRDMILRVNALGGKLLPLAQMNFFSGRSIDFERGPYNQGFSLVRYVAAKYGEESLRKLCQTSARFKNLTFAMAVKEALGISLAQLYGEWKAHETEAYQKKLAALGPLAQGRRLVQDSSIVTGFYNVHPRWGEGDRKLFFVSNGESPGRKGNLCIYDFSDTIKDEKERYKPVYPVSRYFSLSGGDKFVTYHSATATEAEGEGFTDCFTDSMPEDKFFDNLKLSFSPERDENGKSVSKIQKRVTYQDHAIQACVNHRGDKIAVVRKEKNIQSLVLIRNQNIVEGGFGRRVVNFAFASAFASAFRKNQEWALWSPAKPGHESFNIYTPRFSPNDSLIVFSYFDGKSRNAGMVDLKGNFTALLTSSADERDPDFGPDGSYIVYSSNETGIFNLHRLDLATRERRRITNVLGGAFHPAVSHDGKRIAYSNFDTAGYTIYVAENVVSDSAPGEPAPALALAPLSRIFNLSSNSRPYSPLFRRFIFSPMLLGEELISKDIRADSGKFSFKGGGAFELWDPLEKNRLFLLALMELYTPEAGMAWVGPDHGRHFFFNPAFDKEFILLWENRSFPPTLYFETYKILVHNRDQFYNLSTAKYESDNFVIDLQSYQAGARLQLFSPLRKLHYAFTYRKQGVDFYNIDDRFALEYTYFNELNHTVMWTHLNQEGDDGNWRQETNIDTRGTYAKFKYDYFADEIINDGNSWQESFTITASGTLQPEFKDAVHHRLSLDLRHGRAVPFLPALTAGGELWTTVARAPTDNFVYPGVFMKSRPFLSDMTKLAFLGRNAGRGEAYVRFPIAKKMRLNVGPFLFDKIYGMAFVEAGASAGIDPSQEGRQDLDEFARQGRAVEKYMHREQTSEDKTRDRIYSATRQEMIQKIEAYKAGRPGFEFSALDSHVIYESLPDDSAEGYWENLKLLFDAPRRLGAGFELRFENYITPGYPFFAALRYSMPLREGAGGNDAFVYFNLGFSFDNWELIDIPQYARPGRYR